MVNNKGDVDRPSDRKTTEIYTNQRATLFPTNINTHTLFFIPSGKRAHSVSFRFVSCIKTVLPL